VPAIVHEVLASPGEPLDAAARSFFEPRFARDFARVRVHADQFAAASARAVSALGYTAGDHIVLGDQRSDPALLAHELAHVSQQRGDLLPRAQWELAPLGDPLETAAGVAAGRALHGQVAGAIATAACPGRIYRQTKGGPAPAVPLDGPAVSNYEETPLADGRVELHAWGRIGAPIKRSGLEKKYPLPQDVGLPGSDRWHLAGPDAVGAEEGIAYADKNFNVSKTATVENIIRRTRIATQQQGGEAFFDFRAVCRVQGTHDGVEIRILEQVTWDLEVRAAGSDTLTSVLRETAVVPAVPGSAAAPTTPKQLPPKRRSTPARAAKSLPGETETPVEVVAPPTAVVKPSGAAMAETPPIELDSPDVSRLTAETGEPIAPVEPPGLAGEGAQSAAAGVGLWLNQAQVGFIEAAEAQRAQAALEDDASTIREDRKAGSWVGVWIVLNEPAQIDFGASIITTPDQLKTFKAVFETQGATAGEARVPPAMLLDDPGGRNRVYRRYLLRVLPPLASPKQSASASQAAAAPKSVADLDAQIDREIARNDWGGVAKTLNAFSQVDIDKRITSDERLAASRRQLMSGALSTMILWPPPNRVADAIYKGDRAAARLGRIDYVTANTHPTPMTYALETAIALNGFDDDDIRAQLPRDVDKLRAIRTAAAKSGWLDRIVRLVDEKHAFPSDGDFREFTRP
jgi:Domain of unknown function (DUF4157)